MIAVPMMSLVIPPHHAAAMVLLPIIPANIAQMYVGGPLRNKFKRFWPVMASVGIGTFIGGWWFTSADPRVVQLVVGLIVCSYVVYRLTNPNVSIPSHLERTSGVVIGGFAGAIAGMAMLIGPMIVMYMTALRLERDTFIGSIALIYLVTTLTIGAALTGYSQLSGPLIASSVVACVPVFIGMWFGTRARHRLSQQLFERLLTLLLVAIAISLLTRALGD